MYLYSIRLNFRPFWNLNNGRISYKYSIFECAYRGEIGPCTVEHPLFENWDLNHQSTFLVRSKKNSKGVCSSYLLPQKIKCDLNWNPTFSTYETTTYTIPLFIIVYFLFRFSPLPTTPHLQQLTHKTSKINDVQSLTMYPCIHRIKCDHHGIIWSLMLTFWQHLFNKILYMNSGRYRLS